MTTHCKKAKLQKKPQNVKKSNFWKGQFNLKSSGDEKHVFLTLLYHIHSHMVRTPIKQSKPKRIKNKK